MVIYRYAKPQFTPLAPLVHTLLQSSAHYERRKFNRPVMFRTALDALVIDLVGTFAVTSAYAADAIEYASMAWGKTRLAAKGLAKSALYRRRRQICY
jgi:hypothetical protein